MYIPNKSKRNYKNKMMMVNFKELDREGDSNYNKVKSEIKRCWYIYMCTCVHIILSVKYYILYVATRHTHMLIIRTYIATQISTCIHAYIHTCVCTHVRTYIHTLYIATYCLSQLCFSNCLLCFWAMLKKFLHCSPFMLPCGRLLHKRTMSCSTVT